MNIVNRTRIHQRPTKGVAKTKDDDFRARRRKFYRLSTDEKPAFPLQQRNFYNHVMENKEVVKTLSLLSTCIQNMKPVNLEEFFFE